jgi:predicted transcriptional regulator of viral defense system
MRAIELNNINKLIISVDDIAKALSISKESAKVTANRYVKNGSLFRIKKDFYITTKNYQNLDERKLFQLANAIQVPSYISLASALAYYNISTQQHQGIIESITTKKTNSVKVKEFIYNFILIKKNLYMGFIQEDDIFIALPEKALADAVYLSSLGRYSCDFDAINFKKLKKNKITEYLRNTNQRTIKYWEAICKRYKI